MSTTLACSASAAYGDLPDLQKRDVNNGSHALRPRRPRPGSRPGTTESGITPGATETGITLGTVMKAAGTAIGTGATEAVPWGPGLASCRDWDDFAL